MWSRHTFSLTRLEPTRTGVGSPGAKMESVVGVRRQEPEDWRSGEMARREWAREESGADQKGTGKGRRGKWRCPPDLAVRMEPLGRVNGMGGRVKGRMRCEREGRTDSRRRTCVAPESARMGEGVIEHRREGGGGVFVRFVLVGIVRFQRGEWIRVGKA